MSLTQCAVNNHTCHCFYYSILIYWYIYTLNVSSQHTVLT